MKTTLVAFLFVSIPAFFFVRCSKNELSDDIASVDDLMISDSPLTDVCTELILNDFSRAFGPTQLFWNKDLLRVRFLGGSPYVRNKVKYYAKEWSQYADVSFEFVENEPSDIRISFDRNDGSWSYIGKTNGYISPLSATMNFGWFSDRTSDREFRRTTLHEFGHALGLSHEHQHPNANIDWNVEAVYSYYSRTQGWSRSEINSNIFRRYNASSTNYSAYDPKSIMHYYIPKSLVNGGGNVYSNTELSTIDKLFIGKIYPGVDIDEPDLESCSCPSETVTLACDDFEQYTLQSFSSAKTWAPWTENGNGGELQTYIWGKVLKLEYDRLDNPDVLFSPQFDPIGSVDIAWDMYIGDANTAYFNIQKNPVAGQEFGAQFYFYGSSIGSLKINGREVEFEYTQDEWMEIALNLDFSNDLVGFSIDGQMVATWPMGWSANTSIGTDGFSAINFYAIDQDARFWLDDFCISETVSELVSNSLSIN